MENQSELIEPNKISYSISRDLAIGSFFLNSSYVCSRMPKVIMDKNGNQTRHKLVLIQGRKDVVKEAKPSWKRHLSGISLRLSNLESLALDLQILAKRMNEILKDMDEPEDQPEPDPLDDLSWLDSPIEEVPEDQRHEIQRSLSLVL